MKTLLKNCTPHAMKRQGYNQSYRVPTQNYLIFGNIICVDTKTIDNPLKKNGVNVHLKKIAHDSHQDGIVLDLGLEDAISIFRILICDAFYNAAHFHHQSVMFTCCNLSGPEIPNPELRKSFLSKIRAENFL